MNFNELREIFEEIGEAVQLYLIDCFPFFYALSTVEESSEDTE